MKGGEKNGASSVLRKPCSEETKRKISVSLMGHAPNEGFSGRKHSEESKRKIRKALKGRHQTEGAIRRRVEAQRGQTHAPTALGYRHTKWAKLQISDNAKALWQNPEYREKQSRVIAAGMHTSPNKPESLLVKLATIACPNEYQFTGDGTVTIDGMRPDLFNINNKKKVILMHGDYWHKDEDPQVVIDRYFEFGYDCLIVWEHELEDHENIIARIREFNNRSHIHHPEAPVLNKQLNMFGNL